MESLPRFPDARTLGYSSDQGGLSSVVMVLLLLMDLLELLLPTAVRIAGELELLPVGQLDLVDGSRSMHDRIRSRHSVR